MKFQYNKFYTTAVEHNGMPLCSDPDTVVLLEGDEHYGKTFFEIFGFTEESANEFRNRAKWQQVREYRDLELKKCDWTQGADVPDTIKTPWTQYRTALRNLPQDFTDPDDVVFPTKPE